MPLLFSPGPSVVTITDRLILQTPERVIQTVENFASPQVSTLYFHSTVNDASEFNKLHILSCNTAN